MRGPFSRRSRAARRQSSIWVGIRRGSAEASKQSSSRFKLETRGRVGGAVSGADLVDRLWLSIRSSTADANDVMNSDSKYSGSIANRQLCTGGWKMSLREGYQVIRLTLACRF